MSDLRYPSADEAFAAACREWLKSCSCAGSDKPDDCKACTSAFLDAIKSRAREYDVAVGQNAIATSAR